MSRVQSSFMMKLERDEGFISLHGPVEHPYTLCFPVIFTDVRICPQNEF